MLHNDGGLTNGSNGLIGVREYRMNSESDGYDTSVNKACWNSTSSVVLCWCFLFSAPEGQPYHLMLLPVVFHQYYHVNMKGHSCLYQMTYCQSTERSNIPWSGLNCQEYKTSPNQSYLLEFEPTKERLWVTCMILI
ncbi:hypothetical protein K2173_019636 [Erythroxylum novogranatense]|uniref:Uncharacterized protein n=1 Tax=Erythroxylum novogranatense TaxID=1862640 RepID=A0AAV8UC01_9ROSI|nr:hypothetical protein K2173_019636 [Erythroxylum novogranatense]